MEGISASLIGGQLSQLKGQQPSTQQESNLHHQAGRPETKAPQQEQITQCQAPREIRLPVNLFPLNTGTCLDKSQHHLPAVPPCPENVTILRYQKSNRLSTESSSRWGLRQGNIFVPAESSSRWGMRQENIFVPAESERSKSYI